MGRQPTRCGVISTEAAAAVSGSRQRTLRQKLLARKSYAGALLTTQISEQSKALPPKDNPVSLLPPRDGDVVLRDGSTVRVRPIRPEDEPSLVALFDSLFEESRWFRFFSPAKGSALAAEGHREANLDRAFGLVALSGAEQRVVGHAFYAG